MSASSSYHVSAILALQFVSQRHARGGVGVAASSPGPHSSGQMGWSGVAYCLPASQPVPGVAACSPLAAVGMMQPATVARYRAVG